MTSKFIENIKNTYEENWNGTSKQYIWDEVEYAKLVIENGKPITNHLFKDIYLLAKYYRHIEGLDDEGIKANITGFTVLDKIHNWDLREYFEKMIDGAVRGSKKQHMKICHEIRITENELNIINNMVDSTTRRIAFVILCMWKANGNKPFRATMNQITNEIGLNANSRKLMYTFYGYLIKEGFIYRYNRRTENRKRILEKMIKVDSQYGELFIPYDSYKYEKHLAHPTRRSSIALWRYEQEYIECEEEPPTIKLPSYYENMTVEQKENYKKFRYHYKEDEFHLIDDNMHFRDSINFEYIKNNIDHVAHCWMRNDFAWMIGGEVFYQENEAHDKIKVIFAENDCSDGLLINVNDLQGEYEKLLGGNKLVFGNCTECGCKIVKNSNKTKYCDDCRIEVRRKQVNRNVRKLRNKL
ncbi:hypothetical protein [Bacillus benzoevorans]|uniref:Uncharacterized protein n=1 Tax=Bacillus benzoevorans TaxID=1456 RepID=A0A7X0HRL5_9BACI|nr:hypothetical protein [Bacillus benzoevorans]MBB6445635.1 hypothetical protein [Bacillus benzoevorans]